MQILLYEYFSGGGLWTETSAAQVQHELLGEGQAMREALAADLNRCSGVQVTELRDARLAPHRTVSGTHPLVPIASAGEERTALAAWINASLWSWEIMVYS